jgi:hypothetical protein
MTTRNAIAQSQGNRNHKVQPTLVEGRKALVVKIDWTTAPVIRTTVRENFKLSVLAMDTRKWMPIQRGMMALRAGQVIHYTQSSQNAGYYYITIVAESCTCVAGLYKQECHHQKDAVAFEASRLVAVYRENGETKEVRCINGHLLVMARQERQYENLCSVA